MSGGVQSYLATAQVIKSIDTMIQTLQKEGADDVAKPKKDRRAALCFLGQQDVDIERAVRTALAEHTEIVNQLYYNCSNFSHGFGFNREYSDSKDQ